MIKLVHIVANPITLKFLDGQITYMQKRDINISLISSPVNIDTISYPQKTVHHFPVLIKETISPVADLIACYNIYRILIKVKPTIVHAHTPKASLLGLIAAIIARIPIKIFHVHGLISYSKKGLTRSLYIFIEKITCKLATKVFCVSHGLRNYIIDNNICPPNKIVVFGNGSINGIDTRSFNPNKYTSIMKINIKQKLHIPSKAFVIGFVGRMVRDKGIETLLSAWQTIKARFPHTYLLFVGDFEQSDRLPNAIRSQILSDTHIIITHWVKDVRSLYAIMDVLVLPSLREGMPYSLLEAQAMEIPVIASDISGCNEIIKNGINGYVVPIHTPRLLYSAITKYISSRMLHNKHGDAGRLGVKKLFAQDVIWSETYKEYLFLTK